MNGCITGTVLLLGDCITGTVLLLHYCLPVQKEMQQENRPRDAVPCFT
jgi:hypothetical protein